MEVRILKSRSLSVSDDLGLGLAMTQKLNHLSTFPLLDTERKLNVLK